MLRKILFVSTVFPAVLWADVDVQWNRYYGGSEDDGASAITMDGNGNYVVAGYTYSFGSGYSDMWILKLDPSTGDTVWTRVIGGSSSEGAEGVVVDKDGNYVIVGYTYSYGAGGSDAFVVKMDSMGNILWSRTYGSSEDEGAYSIALDSSGNYVIAAYKTVSGYRDAWILKVETDSGNVIWDVSLGGSENDELQSVIVDEMGNYVLAGHTRSYGSGYFDVWLVKLDSSDGSVLWSRVYGQSLDDGASDVALTVDGSYIVSGRSVFDIGDYNDVWILKVDALDGDTIWTRRYGTSEPDGATGVAVDGSGNYVFSAMSGISGSWDAWILKTDTLGDTLWTHLYGEGGSDGATDILVDGAGFYAVSGYTYSGGNGSSDVWVFRLGERVSLSENSDGKSRVVSRRGGFTLYLPDSTDDFLLNVYSVKGRKVPFDSSIRGNVLDISVSPGIYIILLETGYGVSRSRVVVY